MAITLVGQTDEQHATNSGKASGSVWGKVDFAWVGTEKCLIILVVIYDTSPTDGVIGSCVVGTTAGGEGSASSMTKVDEYYDATCDGHVSIWYYNDVDSFDPSEITVWVDPNGTVTDIYFKGLMVGQNLELDVLATEQTGSDGDPSITWTTSDPDTICVSSALSDEATPGDNSIVTGTQVANFDLGADTALLSYIIRTTTGSQTLDWSNAANEDWVIVGASLTETGAAAYTIDANQGAFTSTGQAATLTADRNIATNQGNFTVTGQAAALSKGYTFTANQGNFALTGQAAVLTTTRTITAGQGNYTVTGQAAALSKGYMVMANQGAFTVNGQAAAFAVARTITANQGNFTLTGQAAALTIARIIAANQGAFSFSGFAAELTKSGVVSYSIDANQGAFSVAGQAVGLARGLQLAANQGAFTLTGQAVVLTAARTLVMGQGAFQLTGQAAGLARGLQLAANQGAFTVTGYPAALTFVPTTKGYVTLAESLLYSIALNAGALYSVSLTEGGLYSVSLDDGPLHSTAVDEGALYNVVLEAE